MKIIVCIKQVPDTAEVRIDPETHTLVRESVHNIVNPFDMYAIEEGLRLKEKHGGTVTVISMGPPQAWEALKLAITMGADDAVQLMDRAFAGSDSWATAYTLTRAIKKLGAFDIVLCGKQATDGDTGQVGPEIARQLNITQLTYVFKIRALDCETGTIVVERLLEEGREVVEARLPVLLTVVKDINQPRQGSLQHIRRAAVYKPLIWSAADLPGIDVKKLGLNGSPTQVIKIFSPPGRTGTLDLIQAGTSEEAAVILADKLLAEKVL